MKKIVAILSLMLALLMFAGCAATKTGTDTKPATDDCATTAAVADSDMAGVKADGKLVVGITIYKPMNYYDDNNNLTGFDTEFAQAFAENLGVTAEFITIDWDNKVFELDSNAIDCIWNGMTITDEILNTTSVSDPYVKNAQVVVMDASKAADYADFASMKDLSFAAEAGSAGEGLVKDAKYNLTSVGDQAAALLEVSSGSVDACVIDITMANNMTGEGTSYANLKVAAELNAEEYGVSFRKGSDLTAEFNAFKAAMIADGRLTALAEKYGLTLVK